MKKIIALIICIAVTASLTLALAGCTNSGAKELYDTAYLEEMQNNTTNAIKLYEELLRTYPDSPYVREATDRITALKSKGVNP